MAAADDAEEPVAGIGGASVPYGDNTLPDEDVEASAETALETTLRLPSEAMSATLRSPPPADAQPIELTPSQAGVAQEVELDEPLKPETAPLEPQELFGQSGQLVHEDSRPSKRVVDEAPGIAPAVLKGCMEKLGVVNEYYSKMVVKRPCIMVVVYLIALAVLIGAAWRPFELETDFSAFIKADGRSQREREAYLQALEDKNGYTARRRLQEERAQRAEAAKAATENLPHRRLARECNRTSSVLPQEHDEVDVVIESWPNMDEALQAIDDDGQLFIESPKAEASSADVKVAGRRLQGTVYTKKELTILYIAKDGNALDERVLRVQRDLEQRLLSLQGWRNFCTERGNQALQFRCNPGESLVAYAWPSETEVADIRHTHSYTFDGGGRDLLPQPALLALMKQSSSDGLDPLRYFTKEFEIPDVGSSEEVPAVQGLRTKYVFTISVSRETDAGRVIDLTTVNADYENFIIDEVYPVLSDSELDEEPAHIYYEGDVITGYEIEKTLMEDLMWAIGSITFVLVYMWAHTKRFYLSICALLIIFAAVPVGYVLTPVAKTTIASFLSVFLITGVGSDVVFVFTDFWDQSKMVHRKPSELHLRVAFMISHAGKSCLATSLTTAVSFFANLASALQPLREFGLFMGLCVMGAYALVLLLLPPLIVLRCRSSPQVRPDDNASRGYYGSDPHGGQAAEPGELDEDDSPRPGRPVIQFMLFNLMGFLGRGRNAAIVVAVTSISCIAFTIGTALEAELDQGVPEIFPEDHNQVQVDEWTSSFQTVTDLTSSPMRTGTVCSANSTAEVLDSTCLFYWCEAGLAEPDYDISTSLQGACYHLPSIAATRWVNGSFEILSLDGDNLQACHTIDWDIHVASSEPPAASMWPRRFSEYVDSYLDDNFTSTASSTVTELKAIGIENWELGKVEMTRFFRLGAAASTAKSIPTDAFVDCTIQTMCYFGSSACEWNNPWHFMGPISLEDTTVTSTPAAAARRLTDGDDAESPLFGLVTATVPANKRIDITVIWGLLPPLSTPLVGELEAPWKFDSSFQPQNPWSQRAMASMCDLSSLPIGLRVVESKCWLDRFKQDLRSRGDRFPTRNFDEELERWFPSTIEAAANIWIVDGVMAASKLTFYVDVNDEKNSDALIEYKELWDAYVSDLNAKAGVTANHAFHTAEAWVRAEAEVAIVGSTVETIIIASACAWLGVLIFTGDPVLALIVLGLVLGIISGLAFFMVCVMRWKIGPVEVISLVVFVGYSVTYSLHIAHNYAEVKEESLELMILEGEARKREEERRLRKRRLGTAMMSEGSLNVAEQDAPAALEATPHTPTAAITAATDNSPMPRGTSPGGDSFFRHDATHDSQHQPLAQTGTSFTSTGPQRRFSLTLRSLRQLSISEEDNALIGVPRFQLTKAELRRARTRVAVLHVGGATLSSSLSTFGCSCFLLFCTLTIFDKLGAVVIAVTTLSIVFAVVALPAALMLVGPSRDPWYRRAIRQWLATSMQRCKGQPGGQDAPPSSALPLPEVTLAPPPSFPPDSGEAPHGEEPDL